MFYVHAVFTYYLTGRSEFTFFSEPPKSSYVFVRGGKDENQIFYTFKTYLNECDNLIVKKNIYKNYVTYKVYGGVTPITFNHTQ